MPLFAQQLNGATAADIRKVYAEKYRGPLVSYADTADESGFLSALAMAETDGMKIAVAGNDERILLLAVYDNLGKGASGAAVECMNLAIGAERTTGLVL